MKKNAWLAAILNFIIPGLGYMYAGYKRWFYGWALFVLSFIVVYNEWDGFTAVVFHHQKPTLDFILLFVLYPLVFAVDVYKDVVEQKAGR